MPYGPPLVTTLRCVKSCGGIQGSVLELRGPGQFGLSQDAWDSRPAGFRVYRCSHCQFVWAKNPRRKTGMIPLGS
jgi:hypothetical protein